MFTTVSK